MAHEKEPPMTNMTRRAALAGVAAVAMPLPALALTPDDQALADQAVAVIQSLKSVKGRFVQTDSRGRVSQGAIFLQRPGRARFAYDPPSGLTVVSDGHTVSVADKRLKTFDKYPLGATPLALFLAKEVRLDRGVKVTKVERREGGAFAITARDGGKKTRGQIELSFAGVPLQLIGWTVTDAQGQATRVRLTDLTPAAIDPAVFVMKDPRPQRPASGKM
jgi:outer membrane lipoprotein-sorting protein